MTRVLLTSRLRKSARKLPPDVQEGVCKVIAAVGAAFADPRRRRALGLRRLAQHSYEIRVQRQWRVLFISDSYTLIACDIMNHDELSLWLRGQWK